MGATVCEAVAGDPDLELVAGVDPGAAGRRDATDSIVIEVSTDTVDAAVVDVAIDFTVAAAARDNIAWCAANGVHAIRRHQRARPPTTLSDAVPSSQPATASLRRTSPSARCS